MSTVAAILAFLIVTLPADFAEAKEFPVQARLFAGSVDVKPTDLNTELAAQNLKQVDRVFRLGVEMTYPILKFFDGGLRYTRHFAQNMEAPDDPTTEYQAELKQDSVMLIGRLPILRSNILRLDAFGGIGGSNTTLTLKSASQDGELHKKESGDWFASPITAFGGSLAIGYKMFYFVFEGGVETNKISGLKRTGTINDNVEKLDLSGPYFSVGIMLNGVKATSK